LTRIACTLALAVASSACGGLSKSEEPAGASGTFVADPSDPAQSAELFADLCRQTQASGCSPQRSADQCVGVFTSELQSASAAGCATQDVAFVDCRAKHGFRCSHGNLVWNDGCETESDALVSCVGHPF
jgi:hypothetical protein